MQITIKLFATLQEGRFSSEVRGYDQGAVVKQVVDDLGINEKEAALIFVNGRHAEMNQELNDADTLAIFPPVGGG